MFQLIVAVVAIILIAIMVIATLYWGGSAHSEAAIRAQYAGNMNAAAQIEGAMQLYYNDRGMSPPSDLTNTALLEYLKEQKYLKDVPEGEWVVDPNQIYKPFAPQSQDIGVCSTMNKVAGFDINNADVGMDSEWEGCPPCNGATGSPQLALAEQYKSWPGCQFQNETTP